MQEIRDLEDGFKACKWPHELEWKLMKGGKMYLSHRTIQELRNWVALRAEWRAVKQTKEQSNG